LRIARDTKTSRHTDGGGDMEFACAPHWRDARRLHERWPWSATSNRPPLRCTPVGSRRGPPGSAARRSPSSRATLTALHAAGRDPAPVVALARIPLFARFAASGIAGGAAALLATFLPLETRLLRALPALLAAVTVAAVAAILFCA
jgi:hypothetical protein